MKRRMHPVRLGLAVGLPIGVLMALVVEFASISQPGLASLQDALLAFVLGVLIFGGFAGFVQWLLIERHRVPDADPGWYDSPEDDATQWYWDGHQWTDQTRAAPDHQNQHR